MKKSLEESALDQLFRKARTYNKFVDQAVPDLTIANLYELLKWGPTATNCQPGRYVFVRSPEAKKRLVPCLAQGNVAKVEKAPVTVIVAYDSKFYDQLPTQWTAYDAKKAYVDDAELAKVAAMRNGSLQGAYLILAARSLGLDCGPMSGFSNDKVDAEFFAGTDWKSNFLVNLGFGEDGGFYPRGPRLSYGDVVQIL
ncbi:MAG: malonic semialdehyde reductase [Deltaproteobacteria bacterium]|jgi:nitroreductase|nr:malonic semialdehyde reductase [Deltaproteobacteria bacterium]